MKYLISIALLFFFYSIYAQTAVEPTLFNAEQISEEQKSDSKFTNLNSISFEILGVGTLYSFNYERVIINNSKYKTCMMGGFMYYKYENDGHITLPISINELFSFHQHHIEMGTAVTPFFVRDDLSEHSQGVFCFLRGGYRYQKPNGNFLLRFGLNPLIYPAFEFAYGLAVGLSF